MGKKKTHEEFVQEVYDLYGSEYEVLSEYVNSHTYVQMRHQCGCEYPVKSNNFLRGRRCPRCFGTFKKTTKEFQQEIYNLIKDEYQILDEYNGAQEEITFLHNKKDCNCIFSMTPSKFLRGERCPKCAGKRITIDDIQIFLDAYNYKLLDHIYKTIKTKLLIKCDKNHLFKMDLDSLKRGCKCPKCQLENRSRENHYNWKGGISSIHGYLRNQLNDWRTLSVTKSNYRCVITGDKFDDIHHLYSFNKIVKEVLLESKISLKESISDYNENELNTLSKLIKDKHIIYGEGVCLSHSIHNLYHKIYGYDNTLKQFEEFKVRYNNGEFTPLLSAK